MKDVASSFPWYAGKQQRQQWVTDDGSRMSLFAYVTIIFVSITWSCFTFPTVFT